MEKGIRSLAGILAVIAFFAAALSGMAGGNALATCALRGVVAALVMYVAAGIAGRVAMRLVVEEMVEHELRRRRSSERDM